MFFKLIIVFLACAIFVSCSTQKISQKQNPYEATSAFVATSKKSSEYQIDHKYFKIFYDPELRIARYVTYQIRSEDLKKASLKRKDRFRPDNFLVEKGMPYAKPGDYLNTGYDKGHLAASADFSWDAEANDTTFLMSNMVPQKPSLNRDSWRRLEEQVRKWACGEGLVSIITGPVITENLPKLKSGLIIPNDFFKIVIDETPPKKVLTFLYHQSDKGDVLTERIVSLDEVKKITKNSYSKLTDGFDNRYIRAPASVEKWKEGDCKR